jgi:hypothetical protein
MHEGSPINKKPKRPQTVDEAVDRLMAEMELKALTSLARMHEDDLLNLNFTLGKWIRENFIYRRNDNLLESCRKVSGDKNFFWVQMHMVIIKQLWLRLQGTHKLKVIK